MRKQDQDLDTCKYAVCIVNIIKATELGQRIRIKIARNYQSVCRGGGEQGETEKGGRVVQRRAEIIQSEGAEKRMCAEG